MVDKSKRKNKSIPSRFHLAPINTGLAPNGIPNEKFVEFYKKRSGKNIGITYVGNVSVGENWRTNSNTPWLSSETSEILKELSSTIEANGSLPGIQIGCRQSRKEPFREWECSNADLFLENARDQFTKLRKEEIHQIKEAFIRSTQLSVKLGFKVIQIHAAHGYFLSQLLDDRINCREDYYGSEPLNLIKEIIASIKNVKNDTLIDIRLSLFDGLEDSQTELRRKYLLIERILQTNIDIISISNGIYDFNKHFIYPPAEWGHGPFIRYVIPLTQKYPDVIFNVAGNIWDIRLIPADIPENMAFSIGRAFIADPELIEKSICGRFNEIIQCVRKGSCHYYTNRHPEIYCPLDPSLNVNAPSTCECSKWINR
jgi:2,4-dienoyl-CoA reductase-like NADH-dependent reductase (Old Yellow Enzyme family)